jgi:hypothetical protein
MGMMIPGPWVWCEVVRCLQDPSPPKDEANISWVILRLNTRSQRFTLVEFIDRQTVTSDHASRQSKKSVRIRQKTSPFLSQAPRLLFREWQVGAMVGIVVVQAREFVNHFTDKGNELAWCFPINTMEITFQRCEGTFHRRGNHESLASGSGPKMGGARSVRIGPARVIGRR